MQVGLGIKQIPILTTNTTQTIITDGSFHHQPKKVPGSAKYAGFRPGVGKGMYTARSFPGTESLNPKLKQALIQAANNSLAETTWRQVDCFSFEFFEFTSFEIYIRVLIVVNIL